MKLNSTIYSVYAVALLIPLALGSGCGEAADNNNGTVSSEIMDIDEDVTEDTTWAAGTYRINPFRFQVSGATLTIEPCSTIQIDTKIRVLNGGNIVAIGEPDCPITFTSVEEDPLAGDWERLNILEGADNGNVFEHVVFEYGGGENRATVQVDSGASFKNVTVRDSAGLGIKHEDGKLFDFADMTFERIPDYPVQMLASEVAIMDGITTTDVQNDRIHVYGGVVSVPSTWTPQNIPYELDGSNRKLDVNAELTIEAGTQLLIASEGGIRVEDGGSLKVNGDEGNPVVIESVKEPAAPGDWNKINFVNSANASTFTWTTIRHGGGDPNSPSGNGAMKTDGVGIELNNVIFEDNTGCNVYDRQGGYVTATESSYIEC
jgi:hypothetical protein